jgi:hypothetical protein
MAAFFYAAYLGSGEKVVFLVQLDFECMEYAAQPSKALRLIFSSTPSGWSLPLFFQG